MADRRGVLFDVDGTLVDTSYLHVVAWFEAFRACGHIVAMSELHHYVGQGSDKFVESVLGRDDPDVRRAHRNFYGRWLEQLPVLDGARELVREVAARGLVVVLASSASEGEIERLRAALELDDVVDTVTSKGDVGASKPDPDIFSTAMDKARLAPAAAVAVGDTVWDVRAAATCGVECVGVQTGGVCAADLRGAGAAAVYAGPRDLLDHLETSPLARLLSGG